MNYEKLSNWFWDIAKYVITGIIISTFLGNFQNQPTKLYLYSSMIVAALIIIAVFFEQKANKK
ncbi:MAG: hypothetical protein FWC41_06575 [Firmicutes bacterium]|nr:hypothetical protein [Bacillota bacterium]